VKTLWVALLTVLLIMGGGGRGLAAVESDIQKEIELLKARITELEQRLNEQEAAGKKQAAKTEKTIGEKIDEVLGDRFGSLSIHGSIVGYWQGANEPEIGERAGHYRVYAWDATYDHPDLTHPDTDKPGWGVGLSLDQEISEKVGVFARFAYNNKHVYPVEWFWSLGAGLKGVVPTRGDDVLGIGIAGLVATGDLDKATADTGFLLTGDNEGTEYHLEAYYRIAISEHVAITPDVQYVVNPLGDSHNDDVLAAMLRAELSF